LLESDRHRGRICCRFRCRGLAWIAGQSLAVAPDCYTSINGDLSRVPQDQHAALREGDRVVVTGAFNNERTRLLAESVPRVGPLSVR